MASGGGVPCAAKDKKKIIRVQKLYATATTTTTTTATATTTGTAITTTTTIPLLVSLPFPLPLSLRIPLLAVPLSLSFYKHCNGHQHCHSQLVTLSLQRLEKKASTAGHHYDNEQLMLPGPGETLCPRPLPLYTH